MVFKKRKLDRETKSFFQLWKGFVVFTLLLIFVPHHSNAQISSDTIRSSIKGNIYVKEGTLIYNSDEITNTEIIVVRQKSTKKLETNSEKKLVRNSPDSFKKNEKKKSKEITENRIVKNSIFFDNSSEDQLSSLLSKHSLLIMPPSYNSSIKGIIHKYDLPFSPFFYLYLDSYFTSNDSSFNKYVLASQSIRPPPGLV